MKRNSENALLFGVCAGLADHLDIDPIWVRLAFFGVFWFFGTGALAYLILAFLMH